LTGRYENLEFRLDDEGPAAGGIGRDKSIPMVFSAKLTPNEKLNFSVFAGIQLAGRLKLKDAMDDLIEESDYDAAMLFGATFEVRF
jgi:hypothetical protein